MIPTFTIKYVDHRTFHITSNSGTLLQTIKNCDTIVELEGLVKGYCSSWNSYNLIWDIDDFKRRMGYGVG